ncbi:MAG: pyridoxal phosphate-dependent aminotransferase [SAR324 cluster bacterium]|nr:pyridoxal phosphate-dependent aminotransferase [SAR324 cluster bacterium]
MTAHLKHISSFLAMEVLARAQELEANGRDIIHLEVGEPDFKAPSEALETVINSLSKKPAGYTHTQGILPLREEIAKKYKEDYGVDINPDQILVSSGSSLALYIAIRILAPAGSEIIVTDPCYACYENMIRLSGAEPIRIPLKLEEGFELDMSKVRASITKRTKAILINSPMNPTGTVFSKNTLRELAELEIPVISDEIYADLNYVSRPHSFMEFSDNCAALNGFSKFYSMTGWRLGYLIVPEAWIGTAAKLHQNLMISANEFVQEAGLRVLQESRKTCEAMKDEFDRRRKFLLGKLKEFDLDPEYQPNSAFYVFLRYRDQKRSSLELAMEILEKTGVALTPGVDFGPGGEGFLRFSYANSQENLERALKRIKESGLI